MFPSEYPPEMLKSFSAESYGSADSVASGGSGKSQNTTSSYTHPGMPRIGSNTSLSIDTQSKVKIVTRKFNRVKDSRGVLGAFKDQYTKKRHNSFRQSVTLPSVANTSRNEIGDNGKGTSTNEDTRSKIADGNLDSRKAATSSSSQSTAHSSSSGEFVSSGHGFAGRRMISDAMLEYRRSQSIGDAVVEDRIQHASKEPESILGWQIIVLSGHHVYIGE